MGLGDLFVNSEVVVSLSEFVSSRVMGPVRRRRSRKAAARRAVTRAVAETLETRTFLNSVYPTNMSANWANGVLTISFTIGGGSDVPIYEATYLHFDGGAEDNPQSPVAANDSTVSVWSNTTGTTATVPNNPPAMPADAHNLDGGGHGSMQLVASNSKVIGTNTKFTYTYSSTQVITNDNSAANTTTLGNIGAGVSYSPIDPILATQPTDVCVVLYHNTSGPYGGTATGSHSNIGDGTGFNTDDSWVNTYNTTNNPNKQADSYGQTACAEASPPASPTLSISKVDNEGGSSITGSTGTVVAGTSFIYTIVASNAGPNFVVNTPIDDVFPAGISSDSWTATASAGSSVSPTSGSGPIHITNDTVLQGGSITFKVTANVNAAATGQLVNTATFNAGGVTLANTASAIDTDNLVPQINLSIAKSDDHGGSSFTGSVGTVVPGTSMIYTIVVGNSGASTAIEPVSDIFPAAVLSDTWTAAVSGGAGDTTNSGTGNISDTVTLPQGGSVTYTVIANIDPAAGVGTLINTATLGTLGATDTDTLTPQADLAIAKSDDEGGSSANPPTTGSAIPGNDLTYTIVVSNNGPSTVTGATVDDPLPAGTTFVSADNGATFDDDGNAVDYTTGTLVSGGQETFHFTVQLDPSLTGGLSNTITVSPPAGVTDTNPANNSATDTDNLAPQNDVGVTKVDNVGGLSVTGAVGSVVPGNSFTYTVTVSNSGPSTATNVAVSDPVPAGEVSFVWSGNGHTNVSGAISDTIASLAPGASVVYTVTASVDPSATAQLVNAVTVTAANDTNPNNNTATDKDNLTPQADLAILKDDGKASVVPGTNDTYTITVTNNGPSTVTGATVSDVLPVGSAFVSATGGATYNAGTNTVSYTTGTLNPAGVSSFDITISISPTLTGTLSNTAVVSPPSGVTDSNPNNNSSTDSDTLTPQVDVSVTKVDNVGGSSIIPATGHLTAGDSLIYTITVTNTGPSTATNVVVTDPVTQPVTLPPNLTPIIGDTWSGNGKTNVSGDIHDTIASLAPGASVVYTVTATTDSKAPGQAMTNTVTVTPDATDNDTTPANNTASDTDALNPKATPYDVSVTKDDGVTTVLPGSTTTYTIVVTNNSSVNAAPNVGVSDLIPAGVASFSWSGDGQTNVSGALSDTITSLAPGGSVTYTVTAVVSNPVPAGQTAIINTVTISPGQSDTNWNNNTATDTDGLAANVPDCNDNFYPNPATPLTTVAFNESGVLRAASTDLSNGTFELFYNDERALALGVSQVSTVVKGTTTIGSFGVAVNTITGLYAGESVSGTGIPTGTTITSVGTGSITLSQKATASGTVSLTCTAKYPVSSLPSDPGSVTSPSVGGQYFTPAQLGLNPTTVTPAQLAAAEPQGNTDVSGRPLFPSLYITDITNVSAADLDNPANHIGDWQYGGTPIAPSVVFGAWKSLTEVINRTTTSPTVTLTAPSDPAANNWNLGAGADVPPAGLLNEGYGAEARWSLSDLAARGLIIPGHAYRFYVMDHDGDQNKSGGDSGQACFDYYYPGPVTNPSTLSGTVYKDANNNGVQDSGETGIAGVTVKLLDKLGNLITSVTTGSSGTYSFPNLPAGTTYKILEVQPSGYLDGKDTQGSITGGSNVSVGNDTFTVSIAAAGNAVGSGYNFGEILPVNSATSKVSKSFTTTAIAPGNTIWFSSAFSMSGLSSTGTTDVHLRLVNSSITLKTKTGVIYTIPVPNALITFSSSITDGSSTTTFDASNNMWVTTVGKTTAGQYFLSAVPWKVPAGVTNLAGATMTWTGTFLDDSSAANVYTWAGAAAVYNTQVTPFPTDFNNIGVKPIDGSTSQYPNTDNAGSPENEKPLLIAGALGAGGTAYIGAYTNTSTPTDANVPNLAPLDPTETFQTTPASPQLLAAGSVSLGAANQPALTSRDLARLIRQAKRLWAADGFNIARLNGVRFQIVDLPGQMLGQYSLGVVQIDTNAAGAGWFIDSTPADNSEFASDVAPTQLEATPGSPAYGHVDLLTVIEHELGHALGLPDMQDTTDMDHVMDEELGTGVRRFAAPLASSAVQAIHHTRHAPHKSASTRHR